MCVGPYLPFDRAFHANHIAVAGLERDGRVVPRVLAVVVRGLFDALFVGNNFVFLGVEIICAGLEDFMENALLVVLFREPAGTVFAQQPAPDADHTGPDLNRRDGLHPDSRRG